MKYKNWIPSFSVLLSCLFISACSKNEHHSHNHSEGHHVHHAPNGGTLTEIGNHQFNIEMLRDEDLGKLKLYFLDAHAENFVRVKDQQISGNIKGDANSTIVFEAVANSATGETVGDTSEFQANLALNELPKQGAILFKKIMIRGVEFSEVQVSF